MRQNSKLQTLLSGVAVAALFLSPAICNAQSDTFIKDTIKLASDIEALTNKQNDTASSNISIPFSELALLRRDVSKVIGQEVHANLDAAVNNYVSIASKIGSQRDQNIGKIFQDINSVIDQNNLVENADVVLKKIAPYKDHSDWFIASHAHIYSSLFHSYKRDNITALQDATYALGLIPNTLDTSVSETKLHATDIIAYLHNLQNNTELAVKTTKELIALQTQYNVESNGISLLNNLMYSFGNWRDHETGKALAEILLRIEEDSENTTPGLTNLRVAKVYNELGEFNTALNRAQKVLAETEIKVLSNEANIQSAIAYAGLGLTDAAIKNLEKNGPRLTKDTLISSPIADGILYAEALIALNKRDEALAIRLMNRRVDVNVQQILGRNNADTTTLLANLENNRERQEERENALKREADLKAAQLEAQKRINKLLMLLAGFLALATLAAIIFARYRNKISKELAVQTKAAQSADKMKSDFLGMVSHELRTPLNGIIGIADLLAHHHADEDVRKKTKIILDSGNDLTRMVESIIDMSHIDGDKLTIYSETINPYAAIKDEIAIWETKAAEKGLTFTVFIDEAVNQNITFDIKRFIQCLRNLLSNAVKFTQDGRIHLHMTTKIDVNNLVQIQTIIADTGQGISELVQSKLFTPFLQADSSMTRKYGGAGLNLAITRAIARMMDGDVTLVSNMGRGSEFTFTIKAELAEAKNQSPLTPADTPKTCLDTLAPNTSDISKSKAFKPRVKATDFDVSTLHIADLIEPKEDLLESDNRELETSDINTPENLIDLMQLDTASSRAALHDTIDANPPIAAASTAKISLEGLKVLIVEDMPTNRDIIRLFLDPAGCICWEANNGQEALNILDVHDVDVILMDIRMPIMDGIEVTKIIRSTRGRHQNIPIIALTADSTAEVNAECLRIGMDIFLAKPVISADLTESILFLLQQRNQNQLRTLAAE